MVLGGDSPSTPTDEGAIDFVVGVTSTVRDQEFALRVIETLASQGRVMSNLDGPRIRRLRDRGYLECVGRGIYRIAERWRSALSEIGNLMGCGLADFLVRVVR